MTEFERPDRDTALAFWLWPDWLGDNRDHPGDPGHEPFWMRPVKVPVAKVELQPRPTRALKPYIPVGHQLLGGISQLYYMGSPVQAIDYDPRQDCYRVELVGCHVMVTKWDMEQWVSQQRFRTL